MAETKLYAGLGAMLDGISQAVVEQLPRKIEYAADCCHHGTSFNDECPDCLIEDGIDPDEEAEIGEEAGIRARAYGR